MTHFNLATAVERKCEETFALGELQEWKHVDSLLHLPILKLGGK